MSIRPDAATYRRQAKRSIRDPLAGEGTLGFLNNQPYSRESEIPSTSSRGHDVSEDLFESVASPFGQMSETYWPPPDWRNQDLREKDLIYVYLGGADLGGANLQGVKLNGSYLGGAFMAEADLKDTNLTATDFTRADLRNADLSGAVMQRALLGNADLRGANLQRADLRNTPTLHWADLRKTKLYHPDFRDLPLKPKGVFEVWIDQNQDGGFMFSDSDIRDLLIARDAARKRNDNLFPKRGVLGKRNYSLAQSSGALPATASSAMFSENATLRKKYPDAASRKVKGHWIDDQTPDKKAEELDYAQSVGEEMRKRLEILLKRSQSDRQAMKNEFRKQSKHESKSFSTRRGF
ncbi:MAG: pentapeptide repeat-containing protein [Dehalococcoidia bacterium]|nr:pentapeptide repeat-containing protein [Dehalococcoidia bacterium]